MCLIIFALKEHRDYPMVFAANRDEFYNRPTLGAHYWEDQPDVLAGKDQLAGGTWLGIRKNGRFAAVTNYRDPREMKTNALSRGKLTSDFLLSDQKATDYLDQLKTKSELFNGFNLLISDDGLEMYHYSNISGATTHLQKGIYGLSNHLLNTPWPKVEIGKRKMLELLSHEIIDHAQLFEILSDRSVADDDQLPNTGVAPELEKQLSPIFIRMKGYGTRCSTAILINQKRQVSFSEVTFNEHEEVTEKQFYAFSIIK